MGAVKEFNGFAELRTANDGVIHKKQLLAFNQLGYGNLFHLRHAVSNFLARRCEGTRPCRGIFYEGARIGIAAFLRIAHGMRHAGIGDTCDIINLRECSSCRFIPRHNLTVFITHHFYINALVIGVRVAVIAPEKGTDFHILAGRL